MSHSDPKISVLIPCFNSERHIEESLDSILMQQYKDYEVVVIDDGSIDDTKNIVNMYIRKSNKIRYFYKEHSGIADSLNFGVEKSLGRYIMRLDSDDVSLPCRMQLQASFLDRNPDVVALGGSHFNFSDNIFIEKALFCNYKNNNIIRNIERGLRWFPHSSVIFRRTSFDQCGGYDVNFKYSQDLDLWLRLSKIGDIACISNPVVKIRFHGNQISHNNKNLRSQWLYAQLAIVRHLLVAYGFKDPFLNNRKDEFTKFIKNNRIYREYDDRRIKWVLKNKKIIKYNLSSVFKLFIGYGTTMQLLTSVKERFIGSSVSYKLMRCWIRDKSF